MRDRNLNALYLQASRIESCNKNARPKLWRGLSQGILRNKTKWWRNKSAAFKIERKSFKIDLHHPKKEIFWPKKNKKIDFWRVPFSSQCSQKLANKEVTYIGTHTVIGRFWAPGTILEKVSYLGTITDSEEGWNQLQQYLDPTVGFIVRNRIKEFLQCTSI